MLPLKQAVHLRHAQCAFRATKVPNSTTRELTDAGFYGTVNHTGTIPYGEHVKEVITAAKVEGTRVAPNSAHPYPPWVMERANIVLGLDGLTKKDSPLLAKTVAMEYIEGRLPGARETHWALPPL